MTAAAPILTEQLIPFADACKLVPRSGGRFIHKAVLYRWARTGLRGVKLEAVAVGGTFCTSEAALRRFFAALTAAREGGAAPTAAASQGQSAKVSRELNLIGV
jgi:hypothetical protein